MHLGPYWNATWFLLNLLPISDWLLYQQGLIMLLCWQQICAFQLLLFWYEIPPIFGWQTRNFPYFFSNEVSNKVAFFLWILARVSRLWVLDFFALHGGFLHITPFIEMIQAWIFQVFEVMDLWTCVPSFLIMYCLWGILLGFKVGTITGFSDWCCPSEWQRTLKYKHKRMKRNQMKV